MIYISPVLFYILYDLKSKAFLSDRQDRIKILIQQIRRRRLRFSASSTRWPGGIVLCFQFRHLYSFLSRRTGGHTLLSRRSHPGTYVHPHTFTCTHNQSYGASGPEGGKGRVLMGFIIRESHIQLIVSQAPFMQELVFYCMTFIKRLLCANCVIGYAFRDKQHFILCFQ